MQKFCILERLGCKTSSWSYFPLNILVSIACVASVSDWFRSKEKPVLAAREMKQESKNERGGRVSSLSSPPPPRSFTCTIFRAVFDSRSSFFAPKPNGNACYAGYMRGSGFHSRRLPKALNKIPRPFAFLAVRNMAICGKIVD